MKQPKITVGKDIVQLVAEIDEFKKQWRTSKRLPADRLQQMRDAAFVESVGASMRMAGGTLTNAQIEDLLFGQATLQEKQPEEAAAIGYAEAHRLVLENHQDLQLTIEQVRTLHQQLQQHTAKAEQSELKTSELQELLQWTSSTLDQASMHPLLVTAIFNVLFQSIQPFPEGNGRLARILTNLLLLRAGYDYLPYASLEAVIEKEKDYYHKALQRTQATLDRDTPDWQAWFAFFLRYLKMQKAKLAPAIEQITGVDSKELPPLSMDVLVLLSQHGELSIAQLVEMTSAEQKDVEEHLTELDEAGHIRGRGEGRYRLAH